MDDNTNWTPFPDDNLLGLTDKNLLNEYEAKGITRAELFVFNLDTEIQISISLVLKIHKVAFEELYEWAGRWRTVNVLVGQLTPPEPPQIIYLMYQFLDNLNFKISISKAKEEIIETLIYAHYEYVKIHPFNNGNGRMGRILMNLVAMKFGYNPLGLYQKEGESRKIYIQSMQMADNGNFVLLRSLILKELKPF